MWGKNDPSPSAAHLKRFVTSGIRPQSWVRAAVKKSKRLGTLGALLVLSTFLASLPIAAPQQGAEAETLGATSFSTVSYTDGIVWPSLLRTFEPANPFQSDQKLCNLIADCPELADSNSYDADGKTVNASLHIPLCKESDDEYCIAGVSENRDGVNESMTFMQYLDFDRVIGELKNLPRSMAPSVWRGEITGKHYLLVAQIRGVWTLGRSRETFDQLNARLIPVDLVPSSEGSAAWVERQENGQTIVVGQGYTVGCVAVANSTCYSKTTFEEGVALQIDLVLNDSVGRWINGRFESTGVSINENGDGRITTSVAGYPISVPRMKVTLEAEDRLQFLEILGITAEIEHRYVNNWMPLEDSAERTLNAVSAFASAVENRAEQLESVWQFSTNAIWELKVAGCQNLDLGGLQGVVSSNAAAYIAGPPKFDSGFLSYKVAGLHYAPDGETLNLGTYDLVMRSDVARCLYGFSRAPISATVSVVGDKGEEYVATTIVSEKDGWLKLAAYGFTFSEKEIQVQLRQSQIKTLTNFISTSLSAKQKAEIRSVLSKSEGNTKFICTGIRYFNQPVSENIRVRARAKAACDYAKSINPDLSYWYQTKTTQARSYNGKVMVVSKG